ncbi:hypothetical protein PHYBLDRAFT_142774 [Phycomyces blakesleeanus NRRL 1555(-)]|uniref:Uncharacterized protein n=1 Tax=Phycomyces blakesleeanus (strain ATCC 8743b / DSM 1359 / FGSC 10004 / NBRC 33097 / NRRL 1555) TaxID=763407 RepID=A0A163ATW4_PHYB8|nr:hypothetical protein PHYBLDRAFT_142774 [Phycomyces blakesleeanus NRRL 1555(-)]OAD75781.1 hypothetical protein PHYBLDRAFT_142774 [Phycomyces blakesleeanus NRRL 1555(-)]|eukprot:XP_018293821.1 hypothetical protein PHYBLDRAFT_142774 [Phycomyces blakesleeanus NRRL 1555(-)]
MESKIIKTSTTSVPRNHKHTQTRSEYLLTIPSTFCQCCGVDVTRFFISG